MYWMIISSVTFPDVTQKYPIPQKCLPQYSFLISANSCWISRELLPFIFCTTLLTEYCGGIDTNTWIWSLDTFPLITSIPYFSHTCRMISLTRIATSPLSTFFRYFVIHTIWYLLSNLVCDVVRYNCISHMLLKLWTKVQRSYLKGRPLE